MRLIGIGLPVLAILALGVLSIEGASAAGSPAFCGTWLKLCNKTCPTVRGRVAVSVQQGTKGVCHPAASSSMFRGLGAKVVLRIKRQQPGPRRQ